MAKAISGNNNIFLEQSIFSKLKHIINLKEVFLMEALEQRISKIESEITIIKGMLKGIGEFQIQDAQNTNDRVSSLTNAIKGMFTDFAIEIDAELTAIKQTHELNKTL